MMQVSRIGRSIVSRRMRGMTTMVATEEFPFNVTATPRTVKPAVVTSTKLDSGVQIISRDCGSSVVSMNFAVLGGSSTENASQRGAAHFLACAAYTGNSKNSGLRIVHFLDSRGISYNAYADKEKVVYELKMLPDQVEEVVPVVMSMISSPPSVNYILDDRRRDVQTVHYNGYAANPSAQIQDLVSEAAFGETAPLGRPLLAPSLSKLSTASIVEYRSVHFVRSNIVVTANGISHDSLKTLVELNAEMVPATSVPVEAAPASPYVGGDVKVRMDLDGDSHLALGFPVPVGQAGAPFALLSDLIVAKLGASVTPFASTYSTGAIMGFEVSGSADEATAALEAVVAELKTQAKGVSASDLTTIAYKATLNNYLMQENDETAGSLLNAHMLGGSTGDMRKVEASAVTAAAAEALKAVPSYAVLGGTAGTPSFATVQSWLK